MRLVFIGHVCLSFFLLHFSSTFPHDSFFFLKTHAAYNSIFNTLFIPFIFVVYLLFAAVASIVPVVSAYNNVNKKRAYYKAKRKTSVKERRRISYIFFVVFFFRSRAAELTGAVFHCAVFFVFFWVKYRSNITETIVK